MLASERRSFFRFLILYLSSTFSLFFLATFIFYKLEIHHIIDQQNYALEHEEERITQALHKLHQQYEQPLVYPQSIGFDTAIYNVDKQLIFGSFKPTDQLLWEQEFYQQGEYLYHLHKMEAYYLGGAYLIVRAKLNEDPIVTLQKTLLFFLLGAIMLFTLLGLFLGRIFIKPMRDSLNRLNHFIEDTTHELNTPISTILTNIELLETFYDCPGKEEMRRIEIASKTLSRLYEDLSYLKLNHDYHRRIELVDISQLLEERIAYFQSMIDAKGLQLEKNIPVNIVQEIDRNDAIRLIDNLLSNAIKYNRISGTLRVSLDDKGLTVYDTGVGIQKQDLQSITGRFQRGNQSEGGFGIGLDIVQQVVERYGYRFQIDLIYDQETEVKVWW